MEHLLISACLLGAQCRYDGQSKPVLEMVALSEQFDLVPLCPEQLVGRLAQLAGLQPGPEPVRAADLVSRFSWERIPRGEIVIPANFSDGFRVFP